ncbi:wax ester/triacylglycerol synthase family O-acyltransferase [Aquihabitans daechungensis]|uniref:wax ester/triacylglycerol synthase family O-acyltransferase n=1 Tax=Aquihabitans daechungensis TaxID=1052257 RepID=UPI003B9E1AB6
MHRLSGEDAGFLSMEQPEQAMNTIAVGTLRAPGGRPTGLTIEDVRTHVAARLDQLPSFRWRIVPVPFGLHNPMAVRDPDFELDYHLREATLAEGQTLDDLFARLGEQHLDRRHPLWQLTLVHGLPDGEQALILKYHHCLADGVAAFTTFSRIFSDAPTEPIPGEALPWTAERIPSKVVLLWLALLDHLAALVDLPGLALRSKRGFDAVKARRAKAAVAVPDFTGAAPNSALNDAFTAPRAYARAALPLAEAKAAKDAAGATLNDVVLAAVAGGLRGYLAERDELPDLPLLASVPVSYEAPDAPVRQAGNRFWSFTTSLATDVADPVERLATISATAAEAKEQLTILGPDLMPRWLDLVPPLVTEPGARALIDRLRAAGPGDLVDANVLISNIRGPADRWSLLGCEVVDLYLDGPPSNGVGLNVMLWSYGDRLLLGILAFADALRDPAALTYHIETAFADLHAAVTTTSPAPTA